MQQKSEVLYDLAIKYNKQLKDICDTSKSISIALREHYTEERLSEFNSFQDFLEDVNFECEVECLGKMLFIKELESKFNIK